MSSTKPSLDDGTSLIGPTPVHGLCTLWDLPLITIIRIIPSQDNVYGHSLWSLRVTARVHLVHTMNAGQRQMAADLWTKPTDLTVGG